jgi:hypothetical protein
VSPSGHRDAKIADRSQDHHENKGINAISQDLVENKRDISKKA